MKKAADSQQRPSAVYVSRGDIDIFEDEMGFLRTPNAMYFTRGQGRIQYRNTWGY